MRKDGGGDGGRNLNPGMILLRGTARLSGHHVLPDPLLWTWCYRPPAVDLVLPAPCCGPGATRPPAVDLVLNSDDLYPVQRMLRGLAN